MTDKSDDSPSWFRIRFADGREVEVHSANAIDIFESNFKSLILSEVETKSPPSESTSQGEQERPTVEGYPPTISKPAGTEDAILKILATPWGRAKLRSAVEIKDGLEKVGYQFSKGAIFGAVNGLFNKTQVRRQKIGRTFEYGLPLKFEG